MGGDEECSVQEVQGTGHSYTGYLGRQDGRDHHVRRPRRRVVRTGSVPVEAAVRPGHPLSLAALRRQGGRGGVVVGAAGAFTIVLLGALVPALPGVYAKISGVLFGAREEVSRGVRPASETQRRLLTATSKIFTRRRRKFLRCSL